MKKVSSYLFAAAILGLSANSVVLEVGLTKPVTKTPIKPAYKEKTIAAIDLKSLPRPLNVNEKTNFIKSLRPDLNVKSMSDPFKLDIAHPVLDGVAGLSYLNARLVNSDWNHASIEYKTATGEKPEIDVWIKSQPNKSYIVSCTLSGDGEFTFYVDSKTSTTKHIENTDSISVLVPYDVNINRHSIALVGNRTSYVVNWIFYGCEVTPLDL